MRLAAILIIVLLAAASPLSAQEAQSPKAGGWSVMTLEATEAAKAGGWAVFEACAAVPKTGGWIILESSLRRLLFLPLPAFAWQIHKRATLPASVGC